MPNIKTIDYTLPQCWASYLFYDDPSGLDNEDISACDNFMKGEKLAAPLSCSEDWEFCPFHDATGYGILACDCITYTFEVQP